MRQFHRTDAISKEDWKKKLTLIVTKYERIQL